MLQTPEKQQQAMGQSLMRLLGLRGWIDQSDFWLAGFLIPTSGALPETGTKLCRFVVPASELFQSTPSLCMVWSLVRDSWLLGSWYELLRHNWNSAARLLHYVTIAIGVCVCVSVLCGFDAVKNRACASWQSVAVKVFLLWCSQPLCAIWPAGVGWHAYCAHLNQ